MIPTGIIRAVLAFVLGLSLMGMYVVARDVLIARDHSSIIQLD